MARNNEHLREAVQLAAFFGRSGYVRLQQAERLEEGASYHKGEEVRLVAMSQTELRTIRRLLRDAGFSPGKPFQKHTRWCQPLYGREAVAQFLALIAKPAKRRAVKHTAKT
jgi:hypothetical protein